MTTVDQLREWTKSDEAFAMHEQGISDCAITRKFQISVSHARTLVERGRLRREERTGITERVRLVKHDAVDLDWHLPVDVLIPTTEAIITIQQGCTVATLLEALRSRE